MSFACNAMLVVFVQVVKSKLILRFEQIIKLLKVNIL